MTRPGRRRSPQIVTLTTVANTGTLRNYSDAPSPTNCRRRGGGGDQVRGQDGREATFAESLVHRGVPQRSVDSGRTGELRSTPRGPSSLVSRV